MRKDIIRYESAFEVSHILRVPRQINVVKCLFSSAPEQDTCPFVVSLQVAGENHTCRFRLQIAERLLRFWKQPSELLVLG